MNDDVAPSWISRFSGLVPKTQKMSKKSDLFPNHQISVVFDAALTVCRWKGGLEGDFFWEWRRLCQKHRKAVESSAPT